MTLRAIPVAGRDSMLGNLSGAHGPFFTRSLLILTDDRTGVGEAPGSALHRRTYDPTGTANALEPKSTIPRITPLRRKT